jgi:hypothetical protein
MAIEECAFCPEEAEGTEVMTCRNGHSFEYRVCRGEGREQEAYGAYNVCLACDGEGRGTVGVDTRITWDDATELVVRGVN